MPARERSELERVRRFLTLELAPPVLPDVLQNRKAMTCGGRADRIDQRIVCATAGRELHADHTLRDTAINLSQSMGGVVGIHDYVAADAMRMLARESALDLVGGADVGG